jgi:chromosome segregation and condensation protein ScpB
VLKQPSAEEAAMAVEKEYSAQELCNILGINPDDLAPTQLKEEVSPKRRCVRDDQITITIVDSSYHHHFHQVMKEYSAQELCNLLGINPDDLAPTQFKEEVSPRETEV